jgi:hypothetical protein
MLLQHEDLEQLNLYTRDLSRLLFRSFFGCGVVCGLTVSAKDSCGQTMVTVDAGVALGCIGDPIYVPKSVTFAATDGCDPDNRPSPLYVWLCSCPKCCAPRTPSCGCGCDGGDATPACTREVDWYEIHLGTEKPVCVCGCELPPTTKQQAEGPVVAEDPDTTITASAETSATTDDTTNPCQCTDPKSDCYKDHYAGVCGCKCDDSSCVMLALLTYDTKKPGWIVDYRVRRFIRPVLVRDPLAVDPWAKSDSEPTPEAAKKKTKKSKHHSE